MIDKYESLVGKKRIQKIKKRCQQLKNKKIVLINSTKHGGGVAQILKSITPFFQSAGLNISWHVFKANQEFFKFTKQLHNGLQGKNISISKKQIKLYEQTLKKASKNIPKADFYYIHDPQPAGLIKYVNLNAALRIHIDISNPNKEALTFLKQYTKNYKELIITHPSYLQKSLELPHRIIEPAIDPFTTINKKLNKKEINTLKQKIPAKNYFAQVSRFDPWKDPIGVIELYENIMKTTKKYDLILLGSEADDDPQGKKVYKQVMKRKNKSPFSKRIHIIKENNPLLVNYVQRKAKIIIQKSTKEGFGLTVSEALYKETPVVASNVGGIPKQVIHNKTGYLANPKDYKQFTKNILQILQNPKQTRKLTRNAKQYVTKNFLLPRLAENYVKLFEDYL